MIVATDRILALADLELVLDPAMASHAGERLWVDAPWPIGYRSLTLSFESVSSLEFRSRIGPATVTVNLSDFSIRAGL